MNLFSLAWNILRMEKGMYGGCPLSSLYFLVWTDYNNIITNRPTIPLFSVCIISPNTERKIMHLVWEKRVRCFLVAGKLSGVILKELKRLILQCADCTAIFLILQLACGNIFQQYCSWPWLAINRFGITCYCFRLVIFLVKVLGCHRVL